MNILGISGGIRLGNWDASAALVQDGQMWRLRRKSVSRA